MKKKKGFTLVELLVVIAILAILATVSILGYTSFIKKGKLSNDEALVTQWNALLHSQEILEDKKYTTASQARALFLANGSTVDDFTATTDGYHFYWNKDDNRIYLIDDTTNISTYPTETVSNAINALNTNYLTFTAEEAGSTVTPKFKSGSWEYYDVSQNKWVKGNNNGTTTITLANIGDKVMLRGSNCITYVDYMFSMTGKIAASGSVTSLTDGVGINPNVTLSDYCYYRMFYSCESLTTAPELPAMTLANYCYYYMFGYCSALTTAPELPATTLANNCYYQMFQNCESLTTAPELPATTLANNCYQSMFNSCSALTTAPELPATTLAKQCYYYMFEKCTSLTTAPELPNENLAQNCYNSMFYGCSKLKVSTTSGNKIFTCPSSTSIPFRAVDNMFGGNPNVTEGTTYYWN